MQFIEITPTVCVNKDSVDWVAKSSTGFGCVIYCGGKEYDSELPYESVISVLQSSDRDDVFDKLNNFLSVATIQTV